MLVFLTNLAPNLNHDFNNNNNNKNLYLNLVTARRTCTMTNLQGMHAY